MMKYFNLVKLSRKYKKRNFGLVVTTSFFVIFIFSSLLSTIRTNMFEYWGKNLVGSGFLVRNKNFDVFIPPMESEYYPESLIDEAFRQNGHIKISKKFKTDCYLEGYSKSGIGKNILLLGVYPDKEMEIISNVKLSEGRLFNKPGEICLYRNLANNLGLEVGDSLVVYIQTNDGYTNYDLVKIVGLLSTQKVNHFYGEREIAYALITYVRELKNVQNDVLTETSFIKNDQEYHKELTGNMLSFISYNSSASIIKTIDYILLFIFSIVVVLLACIIFSSIYTNVNQMIMERYRVIGVYLTYGCSRFRTISIWIIDISLEVFFFCMSGALIGELFFKLLRIIDIYAYTEDLELLLGTKHFAIFSSVSDWLFTFIIIWLIVILAALKPLTTGINRNVINLFRSST